MILLSLALLSCPPTEMQNHTVYSWNDFDMKTLDGARKRCGELYPDVPCVKIFEKHGKQDYSVICGGKK